MTDTTRANGDQIPRAGKRVTKLSIGQRRLEWLADTAKCGRYSTLALRVAGYLAWDHTDKKTGETYVGVEQLAFECDCEVRSIKNILAQFIGDRRLIKIRSHAPKRPTTYRLTFPGEQPAVTDDAEPSFEDDEAF